VMPKVKVDFNQNSGIQRFHSDHIMVRTKTKPLLKRKKVPKIYFHFGHHKKNDDVLEDVLKHTHLGIHFVLMAPGKII
jgi:hypothetical protein